MKRWISSLLCVCMVLTMLPTAMADDNEMSAEEVVVVEEIPAIAEEPAAVVEEIPVIAEEPAAEEPAAPAEEAPVVEEPAAEEPEAPTEEAPTVEEPVAEEPEDPEEEVEQEAAQNTVQEEIMLFRVTITGQPANVTVKAGEDATFSITAVAEEGHEVHYQWQSSKGGWHDVGTDAATLTLAAVDESYNGTQVLCIVTDVTNSTTSTSSTATLTVTAMPAITGQPASAAKNAGETVSFSVTATGTGLKYQWQFRTSASGEWANCSIGDYSGANTATMSFTADVAKNGYQYRCVVSNAELNAVASNEATLTVKGALTITQNPAAQTVFEGEKATFAVKASGDGLTYQWQKSSDGSSWTDISGATSAEYTLVANVSMNGYSIRCKVTDAYAASAASASALLTVKALPAITAQPSDTAVEEGKDASFTVNATGEKLTYQWQYKPADGNWTNCGDGFRTANTAKLSFVTKAEQDGYQFRCVVTDEAGHKAESNAAALTVYAKVAIVSGPEDQEVFVGEQLTFKVEASGKDLTYRWESKYAGNEWQTVSGATTDTLTLTSTVSMNETLFRCVVTDSFGNSVTSDAASATVKVPLSIIGQPQNVELEEQQEVATFDVRVTDDSIPFVSYQWQFRTPSNRTWTNCDKSFTGYNTSKLSVPTKMNEDGYQFRCVITDVFGQEVISDEVMMVVRGSAKILTQPVSQTVYEGQTAQFQIKADGYDVEYHWQVKHPSSSWIMLESNLIEGLPHLYEPEWKELISSLEGVGTDTIKITPETVDANGIQFRCVVTDRFHKTVDTGLVSNAATLTVLATGTIVTQPVDQMVEINSKASFTVIATGLDLVYRWQYKTSPMAEWAYCSAASEGYNTNILRPVATVGRDGYQYRCEITSGSSKDWVEHSDVVTLTTKAIITKQPESTSVSEGKHAFFQVNAVGKNLKYTWQYAGPGMGWTDCTGELYFFYNFDFRTLHMDPAMIEHNGYQYRCVITDAHENVIYSNSAFLTVTNGVVITSHPAMVNAVVGDTATFSVKATGEELSYRWQYKAPTMDDFTDCSSATVGYNTDTIKVAATKGRDGYLYRCVVTDKYRSKAISNAAVLNVGTVITVTLQPVSGSFAAESDASFTIAAQGDGLQYRWQYKAPAMTDFVYCRTDVAGYDRTIVNPVAHPELDGYQFRCVITAKNGQVATTEAATLTVTTVINKQPESVIALENEEVTFRVKATGVGLTYKWQYAGPNMNWTDCDAEIYTGFATNTLGMKAEMRHNGYWYRCQVIDAHGVVTNSEKVFLTISCGVTITEQPASAFVSAGDTATFQVKATGEGLTYQWQFKTPLMEDFVDCTGANTDTIKVDADLPLHGYQYRCVITDVRNSTVTSNAATLNVNSAIVITKQPVSAKVPVGEMATFSVVASGNSLQYRWQYKTPSMTDFVNCSSATAGYDRATMTPVATIGRDGYEYRCVIKAENGFTVISDVVTLDVTVAIEKQPKSVTAYENETVSFTVTAIGKAPMAYKWQYAGPGMNWTDCDAEPDDSIDEADGFYTGCTTNTLVMKGLKAHSGYGYRCVVTDAKGNVAYSDAAILTVATGVLITEQPKAVTASVGNTAIFSVKAAGADLTYRWQYKTPTGSWTNCSSATAGYNTDTIKVNATQGRNGYSYRCVVTDARNAQAISNPAVLTVGAAIVVNVQPVSKMVPVGQTASFTVSAAGNGLQYRWQYKTLTGEWTNCSAATVGYDRATLNPVATVGRNGYQYRCRITSSNGQQVFTNTVTLTVSAVIVSQPASVVVREGAGASFTVAASGLNLTYQWQSYDKTAKKWVNISGAQSATVNLAAAQIVNGLQVRCVVKDAHGNQVVSDPATVNISGMPTITQQPTNKTVAKGVVASFEVKASGTNLKYRWQYKTPSMTDFVNCTSATDGYASSILKPLGTAGRNGYQYRCVITDSNGNSVTSNAVTLTVN